MSTLHYSFIGNMEKFNFGYSVKNIPIPSEREYKIQLTEKIEAVIKRMRWKAIHADGKTEETGTKRKTYGLRSTATPAAVKDLSAFENDLWKIVTKLQFRRVNCDFQNKLKEDIRNIKRSEKVYVSADKTSNIYKIPKEQYEGLLTNAVTAAYKKAKPKLADKINKLGIKFAKNKEIEDRMLINGTGESFITLKDHKENFNNNPKTRLINPAKNEIGRISKDILDDINQQLRSKFRTNQWKNTQSVITWFKNLKNKKSLKFIVFDIENFYPSISEKLLGDALRFAKEHVKIKKADMDTILHARKSLLYKQGEPWMKKDSGIFDVTMGAYDGAEVCELVGIYLLSILATKCDKENIGLYRDDGLAAVKNLSGPQTERLKKEFQQVFNDNGLKITIECNLKVVDYLDVTLNLNNGTHKPFRKPNDETLYISANSNHPPNIIKQLPISVEDRLRSLSSSKRVFSEAAQHYQGALEKCGFTHKLEYEKNRNGGISKNRSRKIIWFNPPFSKNVSTNVAKEFLRLVDKHFGRNQKYKKIFNRQNLKVSYSCMRSMKSIVTSHNRKILTEGTSREERTCNCPANATCPMNGNCLAKNVIYSGEITSNLQSYGTKEYTGISEPAWKKRLGNHKRDFANRKYENSTTLSKEIWKIKDAGGAYSINWSIVGHAPAFNPSSGKCNLCLAEALHINENADTLINTRSELVKKCRHRNKYALIQKDSKD